MTPAWRTPFTDLVGCRLPIQQAVLGGGVGSPALAAAVSAAGGLGMLPQWGPQPAAERIAQVAAHTAEPFGMGFFAFDVEAQAEAFELAARTVRVVDIFWGMPDARIVDRVHAGGALVSWQVGSLEEALAAANAGCDVVVAQGVEAGGHVRGTTPLLELLDAVVPAVDVPVVAAGGISTGARMAAALEAGASGVRIGTRFVATAESDAHDDYVAALLRAGDDATVLTTAYSAGWPDAPHRVLRSAVAAAEALDTDVADQADYGAAQMDLPRWWVGPPTRHASGRIEAMALYAGMGVADIHDRPPAGDVVARLVAEARSAATAER